MPRYGVNAEAPQQELKQTRAAYIVWDRTCVVDMHGVARNDSEQPVQPALRGAVRELKPGGAAHVEP